MGDRRETVRSGSGRAARTLFGLFVLTLALLGPTATTAAAAPKIHFSTFLGSRLIDTAGGIAVDSAGQSFVLSTTWDRESFASGPTALSPGSGFSDLVVTRLDKKGKIERMASFGGSSTDGGGAIAVGPDPWNAGSSLVYVLGATSSHDFPTRDAIQDECARSVLAECSVDLGITVLDSDLSEILFSTYLGGTDFEAIFWVDLAVDALGRIAVVSETHSKDFPTRRPTQKKGRGETDAVVAVLEPKSGGGYRLAFSTYLGGKTKTGTTRATGVAFDEAGRLFVSGFTDDKRFPGVAALQEGVGGGVDGFITVYDLDGTSASGSSRAARAVGKPEILFSTTFGGRSRDRFLDVAVEDDWIYLAGDTLSPDFPTFNPFQAGLRGVGDAVLTVLDFGPTIAFGGSPEVVVSTFFGGRGQEIGEALAVDRKGIVHLTGQTLSVRLTNDLPTKSPVQAKCSGSRVCWDAFVTRFQPIRAGVPPELRFSTYLGGPPGASAPTGAERPSDLAVDRSGATYVVGLTESPGYPTRKAAQKKLRGDLEGFFTKIKK